MTDTNITSDLRSIFVKAVQAANPAELVEKCLKIDNSNLVINGRVHPMKKPCYVVGFGKAVQAMALALEKVLQEKLKGGVVTVPVGMGSKGSKIEFVEGASNNLPDEAAEKGARKIKKVVDNLKEDDLLIVLISGGGSALLPLTKNSITLKEKLEVVKSLSRAGADITELNSVRKKLSQLKGGKLAQLAYPAKVVSLILSDIVGDPIDFIASGPTVPNKDSLGAALKILQKYNVTPSDSIKRVLLEDDKEQLRFDHVHNYVIGNNRMAVESSLKEAKRRGYRSFLLRTDVQGDVDEIGKIYAELACLISWRKERQERLRQLLLERLDVSESIVDEILETDSNERICLVLGGEPTVTVKGQGLGGRNQQLALSFSFEINKLDTGCPAWFVSCGTDGIDGPTDAAGAIGSHHLFKKAITNGLDPESFLKNNDSYGFYSRFDNGSHLVKTGHTGTNVMDVHAILVVPKE